MREDGQRELDWVMQEETHSRVEPAHVAIWYRMAINDLLIDHFLSCCSGFLLVDPVVRFTGSSGWGWHRLEEKNLPVRLVPVRPLDEAVVAFCVRQCLSVSAETEQGEVSLQACDFVSLYRPTTYFLNSSLNGCRGQCKRS
jgi:hypothetical protein